MRNGILWLLKVFACLQSMFNVHSLCAFWGKTELDLNGIGVIKEAAQLLSHSIDTFPTQSTGIAFIGLIIFSQGIYLFGKGIVNIISNAHDAQLRCRGKAQFILGTTLLIGGTTATLYSTKIAILCFS